VQQQQQQPNGQPKYQTFPADKLSSRAESSNAIDALNKHGKDGWEVIIVGSHELLLRRSATGQQWQYKQMMSPSSTLEGGSSDNENLFIIVDSLEQQGWQICSMNSNMLIKRVVPASKK